MSSSADRAPCFAASLGLAVFAYCALSAVSVIPAHAADIVECGALAPVAPGRACAVTAGIDGRILVQGDVLADGTIYRGGGVLVDAVGEISCSGCGCSAPDATVVRCPETVVSPGLINGYDHITFSHNLPAPDTGERYEQRHDWRVGARGHSEINSLGGASVDQLLWGELRQLVSGTTSASTAGGRPGLLRNLDNAANQGLGLTPHRRDTFPLGDSSGTQLSSGCAYPDIETSAAVAAFPAFLPVIGEGIDGVARNELLCTTSGVSGGQDLVQSHTAIGKGLAYKTEDLGLLAADGAGIIWSPRSNIRLYGDTTRVSIASALDVEMAIGTDWIVSGSMNMLRELGCADAWNAAYLDDHFSQERLWQMATKNAASLTATGSRIGTLSVGRVADLAVFDTTVRSDYDAILNAQPADVVLVMRAGKILFGEEATIAEVPNTGSCDALDVCGSDRSVCLLGEIGETLAQLDAAVGDAYPLFFCGTPMEEPTCTPMRTVSVEGSTVYDGVATAGDLDGDGIANASDSCPSVFNPIRPVDAGSQADLDTDGLGDECDPTPVPEPGAGALRVCLLAIGMTYGLRRHFGSVDRRS